MKKVFLVLFLLFCIILFSVSKNTNSYVTESKLYKAESIILREETGFSIDNNYLMGIEEERSVSTFDLGLDSKYTTVVTDKNNTVKTSGNIFTGDKIQIKSNGETVLNPTVVIMGDANGDGKISPLDYVAIKNHIMKSTNITNGAYLKAADMDNNGNIKPLDYVMVKNYIMDKSTVKYNITYNANGGTGAMSVQSITKNGTTNLYRNTFTKEGYYFIGWNTKADGSGTTYKDVSKIKVTANITLYAQWSENNVELTKNGTYVTLKSSNSVNGYYFSNKKLSLKGSEAGWISSTKKSVDFVLLPGTYYIYVKSNNNVIEEKTVTIKTSDIVDTNNATLLTERLDDYLQKKNSSLTELNNMIFRSMQIAQMTAQKFEMTDVNIRQAIVDYAYYLRDNKKAEIMYIKPNGVNYSYIYNGKFTHNSLTKYGMDSNAFVSFVIYNAFQSTNYTELFGDNNTIAYESDSEWTINAQKYFTKKFYALTSGQTIADLAKSSTFRNSLKAGDIIAIVGYNKANYNSESDAKNEKNSHLMIYVGDGKYIHCINGDNVAEGSLDSISFGNTVGASYGSTTHGGITVLSPKASEISKKFSVNILNTIRYPNGKGELITFNTEIVSRREVAASALALSQGLYKKYGIKIPYGGAVDSEGANGEWGKLKASGTTGGNSYKDYSGLTCGIMVSWSLENAGFKITPGAGSSRFYTGAGYDYGSYIELDRQNIKTSIKKARMGDALTLETKEDNKNKMGRHVSTYITSDENGSWVVEANARTFRDSNNQLHTYSGGNIGIVTTYDKFDSNYRWLSIGNLSNTYTNHNNNKILRQNLPYSGF